MLTKRNAISFFLFVVLVTLLGGWLMNTAVAAPTTQSSPNIMIRNAWQLAQSSGQYNYRSQIEQTSFPAPKLTNAGRAPVEEFVALEGSVDLAARAMAFTLWQDASFDPNTGLSVKIEGDQAYGRSGQGAWEPIDNFADAFAPSGDPLAWLAGIKNVSEGKTRTHSFDGSEATIAHTQFLFELDGPAFATYMRDQIQQLYRQQGRLPAGITLETPAVYANMQGTGELWLDAVGLPARLIINLDLPAEGEQGRVTAVVTSDFTDFNTSNIATASASILDAPNTWLAHRLPSATQMQNTAVISLLILLIGLIMYRLRRSPAFYATIIITVILSMLFSPLLQGQQLHAFTSDMQQRQDEQQEQLDAAEQYEKAQAIKSSTIDPHKKPLNTQQLSKTATVNVETAVAHNINTTTDSDGDGLTDDEEAEWGSCAYLGAPENCDGVVDPTDSDDDGLGDGTEAHNLTTQPARWDSDGDVVSDLLEVNGFFYNGQMWYLNPTAADSNKDGLIDSLECSVFNAGAPDYNPNGVCPDTDNDGDPDVWDDDNDNDGVVDAVDSSPFSFSETYSDANPMELKIDGLQPDLPVFVDLQFRPTESEHLYYLGNVLDWPTGDTEGQIQRRLDTTFATTDNLELRASDSLAGNGDIRLSPLLQIDIPYTAGHYGNLPVKPAYQGVARTLGVPVEDWLDAEKLDPYGISVRDADETSGDLIVYMPLGTLTDDTGGGRSAFTTRMLYWPSQTSGGTVDWAAAHEYRVVWLVQMLVDECINPADDPDTCARQDDLDIIHVYDESWYVTGMDVREDHGLDVAILYEDPAQDSDTTQEDDLWMATWDLNSSFLRGRDCDSMVADICQSNGQRDVTVANMESEIDTWSGGNDAIEAVVRNYEHRDFIAHVMMTETVSLLDTTFTSTGALETTFLFAREENYRSSNLQDVGASVTINGPLNVDMGAATQLLSANMSWATYEYSNAAWQNMDPVQALDRLRIQLGQQPFYQPVDDTPEAQDEANGKLLWAEIYYTTLLQGLSTVIAVDDNLTWVQEFGDMPETDYETNWPAATFSGATTVAFIYLDIATRMLGHSFSWSRLWEGMKTPYVSKFLVQQFPRLQTATNILIGTATVAAIVGFAIFTAGFFTGSSQLQKTGEIILNATTVVFTTVALANFMVGLYAASAASQSLTAFSAANRAMGPAGLILQIAVAWGSFVYFGATSGLFNHPNGIAFNMALAFAIAQTLVIIFLYLLSLIPIVGTIIVLLIWLSEAIASFFGEKGAQGYLTEIIADGLYDVDFIIRNLDDPDRLKYQFIDMTFLDDAAGYTTDQAITYSMEVTNTLKYKAEHGPDAGKKATFRYFLQDTRIAHHENLDLKEMEGQWQGAGHNKIRTTATAVLPNNISFATVGAGINRDLGGHLYLTESFATPYVGCWRYAFGINTNCTTYAFNGSSHIDVGEFSKFDILPATLTSFHTLGWNGSSDLQFPVQLDMDSDGLLPGTDPSDTSWDGDGDSLSDYYELANGTDPIKADSDDDGMDDAQEIRRGFNPMDADSDDDGLSDTAEWLGWQVSYGLDNGGSPLLTWAWSNPYLADEDQDSLDDQEEYFYALHPQIATSDDAILNTIQFSDGALQETAVPQRLFRFEEKNREISFLDNANGTLGTCSGSSCPQAGVDGRYGRSLRFDGIDDDVQTNFTLDPSSGDFTVAAWFKLTDGTSGARTLVRQETGSGSGKIWLGLNNGHFLYTDVPGPQLIGSVQVQPNEWHHAAFVRVGTTNILYLDGAIVANSTFTPQSNDGALRIGRVENGVWPFVGEIDEVAVYDHAVDVEALVAGRYNTNDAIVSPGDELDFQLTISNTNPVWPAQVVYYGEVDENFDGFEDDYPDARLRLNETAGANSFAIDYHGGNAGCASGCPTAGVPGMDGTAVQFNNGGMINADTILSSFNAAGYSFSFWIKPTPSAGSQRYHTVLGILDGNGGTNRSDYRTFVYYDQTEQLLFATGGPNSGVNSILPDTWYHVTLTYDMLSDVKAMYINGEFTQISVNAGGVTNYTIDINPGDRFRIGGPELATEANDQNFEGVLDEVIFYERVLTAVDAQALYANTIPQLPVQLPTQLYTVPALGSQDLSAVTTIPVDHPSGSFVYSQLAEAALDVPDLIAVSHDPILRAHFDEPLEPINFGQPQRRMIVYPGESVMCSASGPNGSLKRCPAFVSGLAGKSIDLDGVDEGLNFTAGLFDNSAWTISAWVNPTYVGSSNVGIIGRVNSTDGFPTLFINSSDQLGFAFHDGSSWNSSYTPGGQVARNSWSQVAATHDGAGHYQLYINGVPVGDDAAIEGIIPDIFTGGRIGFVDTYDPFTGQIDNVTVYDVALNDNEVAALYSQNDLSLHLHLNFDETPANNTFTDLSGIYGDATCTNCPLLGIRTISNRGAYFDSNLIQTAPPDFWKDWEEADVFTFAAWVRVEQGTIVENRSIQRPFRIHTNRFDVGWDDLDNNYDDNIPFPPPASNEWAHLLITHGSNNGVYINGVKVSNGAGGSPFAGPGSQNLKIGQNLKGYLDDLRLYQRSFSGAEALKLYQTTTPQLQFEFEEDALATSFADQSSNAYEGNIVNVLAGLPGRIGNGVTLKGDGHVAIPNASAIGELTAEFAIMAWIKPTSMTGKQWIVSPAQSNSSNGFGLAVENGFLTFDTFGVGGSFASSVPVTADKWQHVTLVFDANHNAHFYLDGDFMQTINGANPAIANTDDDLYIGATTAIGSSSPIEQFNGAIDELIIFNRTLTAAEVNSAYVNQFRWFRKQFDTYLTVDIDVPTITVQTQQQYWPNSYISLAVGTADPSSTIRSFDFIVSALGDPNFDSQGATPCGDVVEGTVWCPAFDPTTLGGENEYQLWFRAVDAVGNETVSPIHRIYVDDTPPTATVNSSGTLQNIIAEPGEDLVWTLPLAGTVSDPAIGANAGSGVNVDSVLIDLVDLAGNSVSGPQLAQINGTNWTLDYRIAGKRPHGQYVVTVTAADTVGNSTTITSNGLRVPLATGEIVLDERPSAIDVDSWLIPQYVISQTETLQGVISEQATWGGELAKYHFESALAFDDHSTNDNHATCTNCPTSTTGIFGQALSFNGVDDYLETPYLFDPAAEPFSLAVWFNAAGAGSGARVLLQQDDGSGQGRTLLYLNGSNKLASNLGGGLTAASVVATDEWHHAALTYDGTNLSIYLDGIIDATADKITEAADGPLQIGSNRGGSAFFLGDMDEVGIYNRTLSAAEVYALAATENAGVSSVDLWLEPFSFDDTPTTPAWQSAAIQNPATNLSTWDYTLPGGLEDFYQINVRGADNYGNEATADTIWRGIIDMVPPVVSFSGVHLGGGSAAQTEYTFTANDPFLDVQNISTLCDPTTFIYSTYEADRTRFDGITATCRVPGHQTGDITLTACDLAGHCTPETINLTPTADINSIAIFTPTHNALLTAPQFDIPISGGAFDSDNIAEIGIYIDGTLFDTLTYGGTSADTSWTAAHWQPTASGLYQVTAVLTDTLGSTLTDSVDVEIAVRNCYAEIHGDGLTDFASEDATAVQQAINAATEDSIIRLAGTCNGVNTFNSLIQTAHISKSLTIEGGYPTSQNWAASEPEINNTILDAQSGGRVAYLTGTDKEITLRNLTFTGGLTNEEGGGLYVNGSLHLTLDNSIVENNEGQSGGGLYLRGNTDIINSTIQQNNATGYGGGIFVTGVVTVTNSTINHNSADGAGALIGGGTVTINNSTVSNNSARVEAGAIFFTGDEINLAYTTIVENNAPAGTNGGVALDDAIINVSSSIIANNSGLQCIIPLPSDGGYNLSSDSSCGFTGTGSVQNSDPLLGSLADNGGPTQSHWPMTSSPVIDQIPDGTNGCGTTVTNDQHDNSRPYAAGCEIGSVEVGAVTAIVPALTMHTNGTFTWLPDQMACTQSLYRSPTPYVGHSWLTDDAANYDGSGSLDNVAVNYFYNMQIDCGGSTAVSNEVGEFTFALEPGN